MSGAQPKAGNIAGCITIAAEVNPKAATKRYEQGWVDLLIDSMDELITRVKSAQNSNEIISIAFIGNVVDLWERFDAENIFIHIGSDQTSLHIPETRPEWESSVLPTGRNRHRSCWPEWVGSHTANARYWSP